MRKYLVFVFFVICLHGVACAAGIAVGGQKAWSTEEDAYLATAGYMLRPDKRKFEYYESGVLVFVAPHAGAGIETAYGFYGGYFYYLMPILRPGVSAGTLYYLHSYGDFRVDYYIALSIQAGAFSFTVSNYGIGGGLNYMF